MSAARRPRPWLALMIVRADVDAAMRLRQIETVQDGVRHYPI